MAARRQSRRSQFGPGARHHPYRSGRCEEACRRWHLPAHHECRGALVGGALLEGGQPRAAAVARCWSRKVYGSSPSSSSCSRTRRSASGACSMSLAIAALLAIPLGFWMGMSKLTENLVDPLVERLAADLRHRVDSAGAVHLRHRQRAADLHHDLRRVLPDRARDDRRRARAWTAASSNAARTMGVPRATIVTRVVVPAACRRSSSPFAWASAAAWTAVVAAELIGAPSGLGYAIEWYREPADDAAR